MSDPRDSVTYRSLRFAGAVALIGLLVAGILIGGSWWIWEREKKLAITSKRDLGSASSRLESIKRERDDLLGSEDTSKRLLARGAFIPESRIDFIETMAELKRRHRLVGLDYELGPQRTLKFATGASYGAAEIRGSRLLVKIKAFHDGDLVGFLDEFPRIQRGFFPIDRCILKRIATTGAATAAPPPSRDEDDTAPLARPPAGSEPALEAECTLEWITLADKNAANMAAGPAGSKS